VEGDEHRSGRQAACSSRALTNLNPSRSSTPPSASSACAPYGRPPPSVARLQDERRAQGEGRCWSGQGDDSAVEKHGRQGCVRPPRRLPERRIRFAGAACLSRIRLTRHPAPPLALADLRCGLTACTNHSAARVWCRCGMGWCPLDLVYARLCALSRVHVPPLNLVSTRVLVWYAARPGAVQSTRTATRSRRRRVATRSRRASPRRRRASSASSRLVSVGLFLVLARAVAF
jgi:hypothetical protein